MQRIETVACGRIHRNLFARVLPCDASLLFEQSLELMTKRKRASVIGRRVPRGNSWSSQSKRSLGQVRCRGRRRHHQRWASHCLLALPKLERCQRPLRSHWPSSCLPALYRRELWGKRTRSFRRGEMRARYRQSSSTSALGESLRRLGDAVNPCTLDSSYVGSMGRLLIGPELLG